MTQKEIVDAVNRLSVGYNVTWWEIQNDADNAIYKINAYLGAEYPLMSQILKAPNAIYALEKNGKYIKIFDDTYIRTIVIPFIASEILARDEEFTTIYNKYAMDVENGLFTMFQNEFNRVPSIFKQKDTTGVFFSSDYEEKHPEIISNHEILNPKFEIKYHFNRDDLVYEGTSLYDTVNYDYNSMYTLQEISPNLEVSSTDGLHYYTFDGWYEDAYCSIPADTTGNIISDIDVYAKWEQHFAYNAYHLQVGSGISAIRYSSFTVNKLVFNGNGFLCIPTTVDGFIINAIAYECFNSVTAGISTVKKIAIPYYGIKYIEPGFFQRFTNLEEIVFYNNPSEIGIKSNSSIVDQANLLYNSSINSIDNYKVDNIQLDWSALGTLAMHGNKVTKLTIPNSVSTISTNTFKTYAFYGASVDITVCNTKDEVDTYIDSVIGSSQYPLIPRKIEIICDHTSISKPTTFNLDNDCYIVTKTIVDSVFDIYHITYRDTIKREA